MCETAGEAFYWNVYSRECCQECLKQISHWEPQKLDDMVGVFEMLKEEAVKQILCLAKLSFEDRAVIEAFPVLWGVAEVIRVGDEKILSSNLSLRKKKIW